MGNLYIPNLRLSIRAHTCGDEGGRSGKTDIIPPSLLLMMGGFIYDQVVEWIGETRSLINTHIHTGMTRYCITGSCKFESCPGHQLKMGMI